MIKSLALLFLWSFFLAGCSSHEHKAYQPRERHFLDAFFGADSYSEVFENHTLERRVHSEFEPVMTAYATLWDQDMRQAYIQEMSAQFRLGEDEQKKLAEEQLHEDETFFVFIVSAATREPDWNDLERKKSLWRITLEDEESNVQISPERIEVVSQKDERSRYFYQKMNVFNKTYRIRFPKDPLRGASPVVLHIAGPRGAIEFPFDVQK